MRHRQPPQVCGKHVQKLFSCGTVLQPNAQMQALQCEALIKKLRVPRGTLAHQQSAKVMQGILQQILLRMHTM
jgi:hypothetical protein